MASKRVRMIDLDNRICISIYLLMVGNMLWSCEKILRSDRNLSFKC